jgi:hypothetical protein
MRVLASAVVGVASLNASVHQTVDYPSEMHFLAAFCGAAPQDRLLESVCWFCSGAMLTGAEYRLARGMGRPIMAELLLP